MSEPRVIPGAEEQGASDLWIVRTHRIIWFGITLKNVVFFLTGSRVEKFSVATHVPEWAAVSLTLFVALFSLATTIDGFARPPGRFLGAGCVFVTFGLQFDWANADQVATAIVLAIFGVVSEFLFYRYVSKNSTQPHGEKLTE